MNFNTVAERFLYTAAVQEHVAWNRMREQQRFGMSSPEYANADTAWRQYWSEYTTRANAVIAESSSQRMGDITLAAYESVDRFE